MPLYEYQCDACGSRFELIRKFSDPPVEICSSCGGGPIRKLLSSPAFQFKGSGWYVTDYARKAEPAAKAGESGDNSKSKPDAAGSGETQKAGTAEKTADKPAAPASATKPTKDT